MEFKKGDKVRVYDSALRRGKSELTLLDNPDKFDMVQVPVDTGTKWVYTKQLELIERPKQKVKLYKYAYKLKDVGRWDESLRFYNGDSEFTNCNPNYRTFKRLDSTMIEVDDE